MKVKVWNIEAVTGYKPKTTFYEDFSIADVFGVNGIKDTYRRAFKAWKDDVEYLTELVMVLNWKVWEHHGKNDLYTMIYSELYEAADEWAQNNLQGDDLAYYLKTLD